MPALNIFESSLRRGKFDDSRKLSDGSLMEFSHIYPMDAVYDTPEDVPQEVGPRFQRGIPAKTFFKLPPAHPALTGGDV